MALRIIKNKILTSTVRSSFVSVRLCKDSVPESGAENVPTGPTKDDPPPKPFNTIPGPFRFPFFGVTLHYLPLEMANIQIKDLTKTYAVYNGNYGDLVKEGNDPEFCVVHVFNPEDIKKVYQQDGKYPRRRSHTALGAYRKARPHLYSGEGLLPTNGEEWREFRMKFNDALIHADNIRDITAEIEKVADEFINNLPFQLDDFGETDIVPLLLRWGLETTTRVTFGKRLGCFDYAGYYMANTLIKAAEDTHAMILDLEMDFGDYEENYIKLECAQDVFCKSIREYLDEYMDSDDWEDKKYLATKLLLCKDASKKDVFTLLIDSYLAGIDSASFAVVFALYRLAMNRSAQETLRKEVKEFLPNRNSPMPDLNQNMPYLEAVFNETLRLHPVAVGNGRITNKDLVLNGYFVPANTNVILQHETAMKNEKYYKDALEFRPERWLEPGRKAPAFSPFGVGRRFCIGSALASREIKTTIAKFVRTYEFSYHHLPVESKTVLLNFPDGPVKIKIDL